MRISQVNMPAGAVFGTAMHCPTASGGKDWVGVISPLGLTSFWGPTDKISQTATKSGGAQELSKLVAEKKAKGYQIVDEYTSNMGWHKSSQRNNSDGVTAKVEKPAMPVKDVLKDIEAPAETNEWDF